MDFFLEKTSGEIAAPRKPQNKGATEVAPTSRLRPRTCEGKFEESLYF
jgi:hypothetical protein